MEKILLQETNSMDEHIQKKVSTKSIDFLGDSTVVSLDNLFFLSIKAPFLFDALL